MAGNNERYYKVRNYEVITVVHYSRIVEAKNEGEASDMGWRVNKND